MPRVRRTVQDHAAVREIGGVIPTPAPRAAVTAAVLRAWGVVDVRMAETEAQIRKETYVERFD